MSFKKFLKLYLTKRSDAIKIAKLSEKGYLLYDKTNKLMNAKIFKPSLKRKNRHFKKVEKLYSETLSLIEHFQTKCEPELDPSYEEPIESIKVEDFKDCLQICESATEIARQTRKQTRLLAFHLFFLYFTPFEFILSIPLLIYIAILFKVGTAFSYLVEMFKI